MRIWRILDQLWWQLGGRRLGLLVLIVLMLLQGIALTLPQIPVSSEQTVAFSRWLAELRPQLGGTTRTLASLGLLTVRSSYLQRLVLGLLGLIVAATLDRLREDWHTMPWSAARTGRLLICLGGLLVIGGWAGQMLGGWRESEVIAWPGTQIVLPARNLAIDQPSGSFGLWPGGYGRYVVTRGERIGLEVSAVDDEGGTLLLLPSVHEEPLTALRLALTTQEPEAFFAIQEAELIFRINQVEQAIQIQAYRSASGELLTETVLQDGSPTAVLQLGQAEVSIGQTLLPRYEVIYNPGAAFEALGMALLAAGVILRLVVHNPEGEAHENEPTDPQSADRVQPDVK